MTVAELARLFNGEFLTTPVPLDTVLMTGWRREDRRLGPSWVPTDVPTPTRRSSTPAPVSSRARTSPRRRRHPPLELLGAEGLDGRSATTANELGLPGVHFREAYFAPTFSKFQGKTIGGVRNSTSTTGRRTTPSAPPASDCS